jgi:hypothetical protein
MTTPPDLPTKHLGGNNVFRNLLTAREGSAGFTGRLLTTLRRVVVILTGTLVLTGAFVATPAWSDAAAAGGGNVLPSTAHPFGWSLSRMTGALAFFTISGNDPAYYPDTPFQVLYYDPSTRHDETAGGGLHIMGSNTFTVRPDTLFFVPVFSVDDSPPIIGTWPTTHEQAVAYFFGPTQVGVKGLEITVDGRTSPLRAAYLAGPVTTAPLPDGGGTHILTVGAFLSPLSPGQHTVSISGGAFGAGIFTTYGLAFINVDINYTVTVQP